MKRLQIDIDDAQLAELETLMVDTGIGTKRELFQNSVMFLLWAVESLKKGHKIGSLDSEGKFCEILTPAFYKVRKKANLEG
jgi:hypothetical protein